MAAFTFVRGSLVAWQSSLAVLAGEFWKLDDQLKKALNADDGGAWAPLTPIVLGGAGVNVAGPLVATDVTTMTWASGGVFHVQGGAVLSFDTASELILANGTVFDLGGQQNVGNGGLIRIDPTGSIEILGALNVNAGGKLDVLNGGDLSVQNGGDILVEAGGAITCQTGSNLVCDDGANASFQGTLQLTQTGTFLQLGMLRRVGSSGRTRLRVRTLPSNADANVSVANDVYFYSQNGTTTHILTLLKTTAPTPEDGEVIHLNINASGTGEVILQTEGSPNYTAKILQRACATVVYDANTARWRMLGGVVHDVPGIPQIQGTVVFGADA